MVANPSITVVHLAMRHTASSPYNPVPEHSPWLLSLAVSVVVNSDFQPDQSDSSVPKACFYLIGQVKV